MTMGWHLVMEFSPSLIGCLISNGNHSFDMIRQSGECVINLPTTSLTDEVVKIGNCSGGEIEKFPNFGLTPQKGNEVGAPSIAECHANFECRLHDDSLIEKYNFFIFELVRRTSPIHRNIPRPYTTPVTAFSSYPESDQQKISFQFGTIAGLMTKSNSCKNSPCKYCCLILNAKDFGRVFLHLSRLILISRRNRSGRRGVYRSRPAPRSYGHFFHGFFFQCDRMELTPS